MAILYPFEALLAPIIIGTGDLFVVEDGDEVHMGNFNIQDLVVEGISERVFVGTSQVPQQLGDRSAIRLEVSGDSFSNQQLARLMNTPLVSAAGGDRLNLTTVELLPMRQFRFEKDVTEMCQVGECLLTILLWHAYVDLPITYGFNQDELSIHVLSLIAIPNVEDHPTAPYGYLEFSCPTLAS